MVASSDRGNGMHAAGDADPVHSAAQHRRAWLTGLTGLTGLAAMHGRQDSPEATRHSAMVPHYYRTVL